MNAVHHWPTSFIRPSKTRHASCVVIVLNARAHEIYPLNASFGAGFGPSYNRYRQPSDPNDTPSNDSANTFAIQTPATRSKTERLGA